uniref:Transposase n=1 Tax=Caenorhabditis tropicalis TaxID=1561998 RepID=A0A1I7URY0_9PELO
MKFFKFGSSSSPSEKLCITTDDITNYKKTLSNMKGRKSDAVAMFIITGETIYKVTMDTIDRNMPSVKKAIRRGAGQYKTESKTARLFTRAQLVIKEFENISIMMEIKQMPSRAGPLIERWIEQALKESAPKEETADKVTKAVEKTPKFYIMYESSL